MEERACIQSAKRCMVDVRLLDLLPGGPFTDINHNQSTFIPNPVLSMHTSPSSFFSFLRNYFPRDEVDRTQITWFQCLSHFVLYYSSLYHCRPFGSLRSGFYLFYVVIYLTATFNCP